MRSDQCSLLMHPKAVQSSTRYFSREQQQQHYKVRQHSENSFNNQNSSPPRYSMDSSCNLYCGENSDY